MKNMTLKSKMLIAFVCAGLIPALSIGAYSYVKIASALESAKLPVYEMQRTLILISLVSILSIIGLAFWYTSRLTKSLTQVAFGLRNEAGTLSKSSEIIAGFSGKLSEATTEQAASLQETVASIDEISAMISRNADSASSSAKTSEQSTISAQQGKEKVELMLESINAIASGNDEIIVQMQKSNSEISEIVKVIEEISQKTQVINDIVFQTKLLSFNASVEAARAGEHGKGFAVVAEEVGNLASMSGNAATEITEMLSKSVKRVTDIVDGTKGLMDNLIRQSKEKINLGTTTANDCAKSLDEILVNVSSVNEMVREISTASQEQSSGVREVNKAMSELDQVTQANSNAAQESSQAASNLRTQAERLNSLVNGLTFLVEGVKKQPETQRKPKISLVKEPANNSIKIQPKKKSEPKIGSKPIVTKKAVGVGFSVPDKSDSRFEDA